jgi:hypothetical protein
MNRCLILRNLHCVMAVCLSGSCLSLYAQEPATQSSPKLPAGILTGHVYAADTRLPIRFAEVRLVPIPGEAARAQPEIFSDGSSRPRPQLRQVNGMTGVDGSLHLEGVPEGDYLVAALKSGYVTPGAGAAMDAAEDDLKKIIASLQRIHIAGGQTATVNLTLYRGGVVSGHMQYADGSPAIGSPVAIEPLDNFLLHPHPANQVLSPLWSALAALTTETQRQQVQMTDDQGSFRVAGLPSGKYIIGTIVSLYADTARVSMSDGSDPSDAYQPMYPQMLTVYGPGVTSRKDARVFEVRAGEQTTDADLKIDFRGLHSLTGRLAAQAGHAVPSQGMVQIWRNGDKAVGRFVELRPDATFRIDYLEPGAYNIEINANEVPMTPSGPPVRFYKTVKLTAVVADQDVPLGEIVMTPLKPGEENDRMHFWPE